jgi:hypothetical protein
MIACPIVRFQLAIVFTFTASDYPYEKEKK